MAHAATGQVGAAVMQPVPQGRTYIGATVRPAVLPHVHRITDLLGYPSSSKLIRAALARFVADHRHLLTEAGAAESLAEVVALAEDIPSRQRRPRLQSEAS